MTMTMNELDYVRSTVRQVPDFPKPGILFLDITTATKDAKAMNMLQVLSLVVLFLVRL